MSTLSKNFYLFLGFHSFLLGLFPFFLPVYLFKNGTTLGEISWFIAFTGIGFSFSLWPLDHYRSESYLVPVIVSFLLEVCLLVLLLLAAPLWLVALVNGGYSCLFWTIQRVLFLAGGSSQDCGRRFGNFQIYVLLVLKAGIIIGSLLLENIGIWTVFLLTIVVAALGMGVFWRYVREMQFPKAMQQQKALSLRAVAGFTDRYNSRFIFAIDGIFLYLESYFWLISLFLVVGESFVRLGALVIFLAVVLGILFLLIKNRIDRLDKQKVYICAVLLYMLSWGLRGTLSGAMDLSWQLCLLMVVAFCTSFFRLAFNKRFFDTAQISSLYQYLFIKSYFSQIFLAICFGLIGFICWWASGTTGVSSILSICYWIAGLTAGTYLLYPPAVRNDKKGA
ncbi:MAG: hypothetical protein GY799_20155 [Desulfobulbaceae bacterium]|nr:hypothetical protein [Desulfobulbaceae bacterium]